MFFTIVTIIFLPLSFPVAFEFPYDHHNGGSGLHLCWVTKYILDMGLASRSQRSGWPLSLPTSRSGSEESAKAKTGLAGILMPKCAVLRLLSCQRQS